MVDTAEQMSKKLMIGQNQRFAKAHAEAKKLIERGDIGSVLTFKTTFGHGGPETWSVDAGPQNWFFDKKRAAMGAMADLGVHKTDLIQYLLNDTVEETTAKVTTLDKKDSNGNLIGVDDNAICIYKMKSGIIGTMTASWTYYGEEDNSTIISSSSLWTVRTMFLSLFSLIRLTTSESSISVTSVSSIAVITSPTISPAFFPEPPS